MAGWKPTPRGHGMSAPRAPIDAAHFCASPLVRRAYMATVCGLAMLILTLVVLREPFRGYLAEVQLSGPAVEGLDLHEASHWLRQLDRGITVRAALAEQASRESELRLSRQTKSRADVKRLSMLADQFLSRYLPQRLLAYRREVIHGLHLGEAGPPSSGHPRRGTPPGPCRSPADCPSLPPPLSRISWAGTHNRRFLNCQKRIIRLRGSDGGAR